MPAAATVCAAAQSAPVQLTGAEAATESSSTAPAVAGLALGCGAAPVWLDVLKPAWTGVLDVESFSVRLSMHDFVSGKLPRVLDAITPDKLQSLRNAGRAVWRRHVWGFMGMNVGKKDALDLFLMSLN